jgi:hypothetical protein
MHSIARAPSITAGTMRNERHVKASDAVTVLPTLWHITVFRKASEVDMSDQLIGL